MRKQKQTAEQRRTYNQQYMRRRRLDPDFKAREKVTHRESAIKKYRADPEGANTKASEYRKKDPEKWREYARDYYYNNREACLARVKKRRVENPELIKDERYRQRLKKRYGLTPDDHQHLWETQGKRCLLCETEVPLRGHNSHVDHCHATGRIRGILCSPCNTRVGVLENRGSAGLAKDMEYAGLI